MAAKFFSLARAAATTRWIVAIWLVASGCGSWKHGSYWRTGGEAPVFPSQRAGLISELVPRRSAPDSAASALHFARRQYDRAEELARADSPRCVDAFYGAALASWSAAQQAEEESPDASDRKQALRLYHDSLARLVHEGQVHRRLNPSAGLSIVEAGATKVVPVHFHGFVFGPADSREWLVVGDYWHTTLTREVARDGVGVPLVVRSGRSRKEAAADSLPPEVVFAATVVLRPDGSALDLYDPVRETCADLSGEDCRLARDLSAPLAYYMHFHERSRLEGFLRPTKPGEEGQLAFLEPFQPDKIPLVFLHGLLSDPRAWSDVYNELRACPDLMATYQVWAFRYPTGEPFVKSAARLRHLLDEVRQRYDPDRQNPLLCRTVLVGHSMGGLIARLAISHSGETLWRSGMNVELEDLSVDERTRAALAQRLYFDPHPMVARVVFVATPHQGSAFAGRAIGRVASAMVASDEPGYEQLRRNNPGALKDSYGRGLPTSIDLLEPDHPLLKTIAKLPMSERVAKHSIIGHGYPSLGQGDSDSIVPVTSARLKGVQSELLVRARHGAILHHPEFVAELRRILRLHAAQPLPEAEPIGYK